MQKLTTQWVYKESRASRIRHIPCVCAAQLVNGLAESLAHLEMPLDLQHLCTQSCSVCVLKIGVFKAHLYCASFIKLIKVSIVMFWPAPQVPNSPFQTITLSEQSLQFLFVCFLVCFFSSPWKCVWEIQSNGSPTSGESGTKDWIRHCCKDLVWPWLSHFFSLFLSFYL